MDITRRKFFFFGLAAGVGLLLPDKNIIPSLWNPTAKQIEFFNIPPNTHMSLYGIPYHESNHSVGSWLGLPRGEATKEIIKLVQMIENARP